MKTSTLLRTMIASLTFFSLSAAAGAAESEMSGTLNVTVVDEQGAVVADAPVYIYGEHKTHFCGGKDIPGTTTLTMLPGEYRVSTAIVKKNGSYLDRYASHEAHVQVMAGDNTMVVLRLTPLDDPTSTISSAELHHLGIPNDVAQALN